MKDTETQLRDRVSFKKEFLCVEIFANSPRPPAQWKERRVYACGRHVIDEYGDHVHSCKKHTGSTKSAHETVLDTVRATRTQVSQLPFF